MNVIGIMGSGPKSHLPDLQPYQQVIDSWIGVDRGAYYLLERGITPQVAVGDFDSVDEQQKAVITQQVHHLQKHPAEKDATDLELALERAIQMKPKKLYLFGVTGGRLDHALINIQLLLQPLLAHEFTRGIIIDQWNQLELKAPGIYEFPYDREYPYISFIAFSEAVKNISLKGFYYPLENFTLTWGSTRCISNEIHQEKGTVSFTDGLLLLIRSKDGSIP